jgi:hypothetical protein
MTYIKTTSRSNRRLRRPQSFGRWRRRWKGVSQVWYRAPYRWCMMPYGLHSGRGYRNRRNMPAHLYRRVQRDQRKHRRMIRRRKGWGPGR